MNDYLVEAVLILNPLASPFYLNEKLKKAKFATVACFTSIEIEHLIKPCLDQKIFDAVIFLSKDFDRDIELIHQKLKVKNLKVVLAFSSSEYDLPYSDKITYYFSPEYSNLPETSAWRCNKRLMNTRLGENGTPATQQTLVVDRLQRDWNDMKFPLVVKPTEGSGGSMGVSICYTADELKNYFNTLESQKWAYCLSNEFVLEELLIGEEYIIDMVVWDSKCHLVGIYYADKEVFGAYKICRHREFLSHEHPVSKKLFEYCSIVLGNLDVRYGMMHLECMMTKNGPLLIELNPRVSGVSGMLNYFSETLTGYEQVSTFINLMRSQGEWPHHDKAKLPKYGVVFYLQNFGFAYKKINEKLFKKVSSYNRHLVNIPCQNEKTYPQNLLDTVAFVILANDSLDQVQRDLKELKALEASGAFFE